MRREVDVAAANTPFGALGFVASRGLSIEGSSNPMGYDAAFDFRAGDTRELSNPMGCAAALDFRGEEAKELPNPMECAATLDFRGDDAKELPNPMGNAAALDFRAGEARELPYSMGYAALDFRGDARELSKDEASLKTDLWSSNGSESENTDESSCSLAREAVERRGRCPRVDDTLGRSGGI